MNILASPLPATVEIGGASVLIKTGYRTGIQVARIADSELPQHLIVASILGLYFGCDLPGDADAAFSAAMAFYRCGDEAPTGKKHARLLDWDHDAGMVLADFRREYGIDLADPATKLHWWVFMAYFTNLSTDSQTKQALYYRTTRRPSDLRGADAKRFDALKKAYALPPRTVEDALAREAAMWGDE